MQHADKLIAMRKQGWLPSMVYIDLDFKTRVDRLTPFNPEFPDLFIAPDESVQRLDLRMLVDLTVKVTGNDAERVAAVTEACVKAKAKRVIGVTHQQHGTPEYPRFDVVRITDTEGALTWPTC